MVIMTPLTSEKKNYLPYPRLRTIHPCPNINVETFILPHPQLMSIPTPAHIRFSPPTQNSLYPRPKWAAYDEQSQQRLSVGTRFGSNCLRANTFFGLFVWLWRRRYWLPTEHETRIELPWAIRRSLLQRGSIYFGLDDFFRCKLGSRAWKRVHSCEGVIYYSVWTRSELGYMF